MPQVFITTEESTPDQLRLTARFLQELAALAEGQPASGTPAPPVFPLLDDEDIRVLEAQRAEAQRARDVDHVSELPPVDPRPTLDLRAAFGRDAGLPVGDTSVTIVTPVHAVPPPPVAPPSPAANAAAGGTAPLSLDIAAETLAGVQLDKKGFPWDKRIHSETPKINADGRWRQRRNLDNPTLLAVEDELISRGYGKTPETPRIAIPPPPAPSPFACVVPSPPPAAPVIPPPPPTTGGADGTPNAVAPMVIPSPPPAVAASAPNPGFAGGVPSGALAFRALMNLIGPHTLADGRLSLDVMKPIHAQFGATGWQDYVTKCNDKIPALTAVIQGMLS